MRIRAKVERPHTRSLRRGPDSQTASDGGRSLRTAVLRRRRRRRAAALSGRGAARELADLFSSPSVGGVAPGVFLFMPLPDSSRTTALRGVSTVATEATPPPGRCGATSLGSAATDGGTHSP